MKLKIFISGLILLVTLAAESQNSQPVNQTDKTGKKTGYWIKKEGNIKIYEGYFRDDHPVGEFRRYNSDNTIRSLLIFSEDGLTADATFYHPNGFVASKGKYVRQRKEGKWKFYSSQQQDYLISEEEYIGDLKNGLSVKYYPGGTVAEKLTYINDMKQGEWTLYYPDGALHLKTSYVNNRLSGPFEVWFDNGKPEVTGNYRNDRRDGHWIIYKENGAVRYELDYVNGFTKDRKMTIDESDYIDSLERNIDKIPDPEKTGELW